MSNRSRQGKKPSQSVRSNSAHRRSKTIPNSHSAVQLVDQKPEPKQEEIQESNSLGTCLIKYVLNNPIRFVVSLAVVTYLVCAVIHFGLTGDTGMLTVLLSYLEK